MSTWGGIVITFSPLKLINGEYNMNNKAKEVVDWCKLIFWVTSVLICIYLWGAVLKAIFDYLN